MFGEVAVVVDIQVMHGSVEGMNHVMLASHSWSKRCVKWNKLCSLSWDIIRRKGSPETPPEHLPISIWWAFDICPFKCGFRPPCAPHLMPRDIFALYCCQIRDGYHLCIDSALVCFVEYPFSDSFGVLESFHD